METRAPAVVAVVVTTGSAPGLEATLASLTAQNYEELSLLVLANGADENVAARVAAVAPLAFVKVLEENRGYAAACNEAAVMVEGSAFFLFCHDDVKLDPDAVAIMVEAAFRTNAGVVTPKFVSYEDPMVLLHVGQTCDRFGVVRERVEVGEIDHGQQDLERDVFVAPGGATLVRSDLFATLRGFDPLIPALGEDLDFCWRAQSAGARIVVAPAARVAHRETIATNERPVSALGTKTASRQTLQRRHQLLVAATGWGRWRSFSTMVLLAVMDAMELLLAVVGRDHDRASAIVGSWRWLLANRKRVFERRAQRRSIKVLSDDELSRLQVGGASRLQRFFLTLVREGLDRARGILPDGPVVAEVTDESVAGVGFAAAFAEVEEFDEGLAPLEAPTSRPSRFLTSFRGQVAFLAIAGLLWAIGSRNLVATHLPLVGRLAPLDSWWSTWRHFFASWSPNGLGTGTPGMPGYGLLGFAGTFVFGRMGILPRLALIGAVPFGAIGMSRLLKGRVSNRARVVGVVAYMALPTGLNMISQGRIDILAVVAGLPFIVRRLLDQLAVPGFRTEAYPEPVPFGHRGWRVTEAGQRMSLIMMIATVSAFAPVMIVLVALIVLGVTVGRWLHFEQSAPATSPLRLLGSLCFNVEIFLLPLTVDTALAGRRAPSVFGLARGPWSAPTLSSLLRASDGLFGTGWSGWLLPLAAVGALLLARRERFAMAATFATVSALTLVLTALSAHHLLGSFTPDIDALLALYGLGLAALVAIGVSAIELDLRDIAFGWRQLVAAVSVVVLVALIGPYAVAMGSGRFDLPSTSVAESLSSLAPATGGGYRILWLGDPSVLPVAGWSVAPGLAAATSTNGLPGGNVLFSPPNSGTTDVILSTLGLVLRHQTVSLASVLAPAGISAVVVVTAAAPRVPGERSADVRTLPAGLLRGLQDQDGLSLELSTSSVTVFANAEFHGLYSEVDPKTGLSSPLFSSSSASGPLHPGWRQVHLALAPASAFSLDVNGHPTPRDTSNGWVPTYQVPTSTKTQVATVSLHQFPLNGILAMFTLGMWLIIWLGFGWIQRLEWLFVGRPRRRGESQ